jgi:hypothetical protein
LAFFAAYTPENWSSNIFHTLVNQSYHVPSGYNLMSLVTTKALSEMYTPASGGVNYMVDKTQANNLKQGTNPMASEILKRWKFWLDQNPCANLEQFNHWPDSTSAFDKQAFCEAFRNTVQYAWDLNSKHANSCGEGADSDMCILKHIIGYNSTTLGGKEPESVQAIMRNVPYGDGKSVKRYHMDKWLLFWAPFDSQFNLNPYARLIHNAEDGVDAPGAYSFSIDDKYGNYREKSSGFIVNLGGDSKLLNKEPYDPYQQYFVAWGPGWSKAKVCGREVQINELAGNSRVSMWENGQKKDYCDITMHAGDAHFLKLRVIKKEALVTDPYTGKEGHKVYHLENISSDFCRKNSSESLRDVCDQINFSANLDPNGDVVYFNLPDEEKPKVNINLPGAPKLPDSDFKWPGDLKLNMQGKTAVHLKWEAAQVAGASNGITYQVSIKPNDGVVFEGCDPTQTTCKITQLTLGKAYQVTVTAKGDKVPAGSQKTASFTTEEEISGKLLPPEIKMSPCGRRGDSSIQFEKLARGGVPNYVYRLRLEGEVGQHQTIFDGDIIKDPGSGVAMDLPRKGGVTAWVEVSDAKGQKVRSNKFYCAGG